MTELGIQFNDGVAYERMMGRWSRLAGDTFIDWLAVESGLRWVDVGCGNGAFTQAVMERCAPSSVEGIDPSPGQLEYALTRSGTSLAQFQQGDAMSLPLDDDSVDVAAMALAIFFVPDPAKGVAEMQRVVVPGGTVAAYAWDILGGGFPLNALQEELRAMGLSPPLPPSVEASRLGAMQELWVNSGLVEVEVSEITVERSFTDFDDLWETSRLGASVGSIIASMAQRDVDALKQRLKAQFPVRGDGSIAYTSRANAVKGRVSE